VTAVHADGGCVRFMFGKTTLALVFNASNFQAFITKPHFRTTYVDAAYCYRPSSVVCVSVGRSACHSREPAKTAEPIQMPFGFRFREDSRNHVLDGVQIAPWEGAILRGGEWAARCKV